LVQIVLAQNRGMGILSRTLAIGAAGAFAAALLGGCATGMGKDECVAADWRTIGYEDGLHGLPSDHIGAHRAACAKYQVAPNLAAYSEGRERGLREYCEPKNGFRAGINGYAYANVCSGAAEAAFVDSYRHGRQIHDARSELHSTQARLRGAREGVAQTETAMANVTAELVQPKVTTDRRAWLATELVRLTQQRTDLLTRIDQLTQRTQQLALNVQELERQSPYPL
jgi:hypothetical protein